MSSSGAAGAVGVVSDINRSFLTGSIFLFFERKDGAAAGFGDLTNFEDTGAFVFELELAGIEGAGRNGPEIVNGLLENNFRGRPVGFSRGFGGRRLRTNRLTGEPALQNQYRTNDTRN